MVSGVAADRAGEAAGLVDRLIRSDGGDGHPHRRRLLEPTVPLRDIADAVHALCAVHGRHPGMAEEARGHVGPIGPVETAAWLDAVSHGFADERGWLVRLAAAAGPLPSTPGQAETEAALAGQRQALSTLARSDRQGCAIGAVAALVIDWATIRPVLVAAADRFGVAVAASTLPPTVATLAATARLAISPAAERAMGFGAQQLLAQNRGLWALLEARAGARG